MLRAVGFATERSQAPFDQLSITFPSIWQGPTLEECLLQTNYFL